MSAQPARAVPAGSRSELALCAVLAAAIHLPVLAWGAGLLLTEPAAAAQQPGNISIDVDISSPLASAELSPAVPEIEVSEPAPLERPRERPLMPAPEEPAEPEPEPRRNIEIETPPIPEEVLKPRPEPSRPRVRTGITGSRAAAVARCTVTYPQRARRRGWQGVAAFRVEVLASGRAGRVELVTSSGHRALDRAGLGGLRRGRFLPKTEGGKAVDSEKMFRVRFVLIGGQPRASAE